MSIFFLQDTTTFPFAENLYLMIDVRLVDPERTPTPTSTPETSEDEGEEGSKDESGNDTSDNKSKKENS